MKLLEGKKALIFGIANKNSIAWGIAQAFHEHGATLGFSYGIPQLEKRVFPFAQLVGWKPRRDVPFTPPVKFSRKGDARVTALIPSGTWVRCGSRFT